MSQPSHVLASNEHPDDPSPRTQQDADNATSSWASPRRHAAAHRVLVVEPDGISSARLSLRLWTPPGSRISLLEFVAEDTETLARVRLDLSVPQGDAACEALGALLATRVAMPG